MTDGVQCQDLVPVKLAYDEFKPSSSCVGPPIILLHGLYLHRKIYRNVAKRICEKTQRKVYCLDLRSHGDSPFTKDTGVIEMAMDVKNFIEEHNLEVVSFICHSFSSRIATVIAMGQPDLVEKLVFIDIAPYSVDTSRLNMQRIAFEKISAFRECLGPSVSFETAVNLMKRITLSVLGSPEMADVYTQLLQKDKDGVKIVIDYETIHKASEKGKLQLKPLGVFTGPVLFFVGSASGKLKDDDDSSMKEYFPNTKMVEIPNAGHLLVFTHTEVFLTAVVDFMDPFEDCIEASGSDEATDSC